MTSVDTFKALKSGGREHVLWPRPFPAGGQLSSWLVGLAIVGLAMVGLAMVGFDLCWFVLPPLA